MDYQTQRRKFMLENKKNQKTLLVLGSSTESSKRANTTHCRSVLFSLSTGGHTLHSLLSVSVAPRHRPLKEHKNTTEHMTYTPADLKVTERSYRN